MTTGSKIIAGLRDAVAHSRGDVAAARVSTVNVPNEVDVRQIRHRMEMTQREFALRFGFSVCTIRNWEQGRRYPDGSDRVLLTLIEREPETVQRILAAIMELTAQLGSSIFHIKEIGHAASGRAIYPLLP